MSPGLILVLLHAAAAALDPFSAEARIREAIETVQPVAYRSGQVAWDDLAAEMRSRAEGAADTADMLPVYQTLLSGLGDGHSFLQPPVEVMAAWRERYGDQPFVPGQPSRRRPSSTFVGRGFEEAVDLTSPGGATIRMVAPPAFAGGGEAADAYADRLFEQVAAGAGAACGYVVDLRGNTGGNIWPMLVGLSGLLGDGPQGLFRNADGADVDYAALRAGVAVVAEGPDAGVVLARARDWRPLPGLTDAPVAVLVDDGTASSGEGVALAFVGRPFTRSFGARTYGVASANQGYTLGDGVTLVVTVAMMRDPSGATHPEGYAPDDPVDPAGEAVVEAALAWLNAQPACRAKG